MDHDFMKNLDIDQLNSIIDCMYPIHHDKDSLIIEEGDIGQLLYLIEGILTLKYLKISNFPSFFLIFLLKSRGYCTSIKKFKSNN